MNIKSIYIIGITLLLFLIPQRFLAQEIKNIQLLDQSNSQPIVHATYIYGEQKGLSNEKGMISLQLQKNIHLEISHIVYGKAHLSEEQIKQAIASGVISLEPKETHLYPVTVIAVRDRNKDSESLDLAFEDKMAHDGGALLNQIPVINSIRKSGSYGFDPVLRGFKYDQLNIVMNGAQSATAACPNRMDPPTSQMAPNMMDRIEVLKGPHALRYGTGFGGTINFIPSKLRFSDSLDVYGRLSAGYESNGNVFRSEAMAGLSAKKINLELFGSWAQGSDYLAGDGSTVQSDFSRSSFGTNLGIKIANNQQLRVSATYNRARDVDFPALPMDLREDDTWMFNARHDITINKGNLSSWNTTVFGSFVNHLMDNLLKPLDPRMMNAETFATTHNYGGRTEGVWNFKNGITYTGLDLRVEGANGTRVREFLMGPNQGKILEDNAWQDGRISKSGIFAEHHLIKNNFQFVFSGRLELNQSHVNKPSQEFQNVYVNTEETQINPSISIGSIRKIDKFSLGLWLGRAQRSGSLTERFINYFPVGLDPYEMLGNPQLLPEVNNQADLTLEWKTKKTAISLDVFTAYLQNYISSFIDTSLQPRLPTSPGVRTFTNIDAAFKSGFEISWSQILFAGLQHQLSIAYTYGQDLERKAPLPEIAPIDIRYTLRGSYFNHKLKPEVMFRHVVQQERISSEFGETITPSFTLIDLNIGYQVTQMIHLKAG
ncbi:MAG: TonB-dependent receptor, partial [Bacteroidetes bacterium]|nr:TonB-dependent receptor [Bacteroidota bacterium]